MIENRLHPEHRKERNISTGTANPGEKPDPDEIPVEEADYEYFARPGRDFSFLTAIGAELVYAFLC